jgi:hypothetical protein
MENAMVGLGLGLGLGSRAGRNPPNPLCDAIAALKLVTATDGNVTLKLAPHVVYRRGRREIPTLDAVLIERNGNPVNRESIRTYRVDDLTDITVIDEGFTVFADFDPDEPEYAGRTVCIVQAV